MALQVEGGTVCSPDTLSGMIWAEDPDGLDSLWISVDQAEQGVDGLLRPVLETQFQLPVRPGLEPGSLVDVRLKARDLAGYTDTTSRLIAVIRCTATT